MFRKRHRIARVVIIITYFKFTSHAARIFKLFQIKFLSLVIFYRYTTQITRFIGAVVNFVYAVEPNLPRLVFLRPFINSAPFYPDLFYFVTVLVRF